ncbi:MAG: DUF11 domain-containing protein [Acidimicrobiales bacterium]|nr:DUF11 domain-containing protein [Acidimicrobiales bacterium]
MNHSSTRRWDAGRSRFRFRRHRTALALLAVTAAGLTTALATPASAAPGDPLGCAVGTIWISQGPSETNGVPTQLQKATVDAGGTTVFTAEGPANPIPYNAIGYRVGDGYLYGLRSDVGNQTVLARIGEAGSVDPLGAVTGLPGFADSNQYNQGTFGEGSSADTLFVRGSLGGTSLHAIDVDAATSTTVSLDSSVPNLSDIVFRDGAVWGFLGSTAYRMDPTTGAVSQFATGLGDLAGHDFGGQWVYGNGNIGLSSNAGRVFQVAIGDPSSTSPTFTLVTQGPAPAASRNDGTSCAGPDADLGITKSGPATYVAGEQVSYALTVTNDGPGASSGGIVTDTLPPSLTSPSTSTPGCSFSGQDLSCSFGALAVGATTDIAVTATAAASAVGPIANTASVLGNERDPNPANDTSTTTATPDPGLPVLAATKSVDPNGPVTAGSVLTYTVAVENTSDVDSTGTTLTDGAPDGTTYVAGSATLGGNPLADVGDASPFEAGGPINSPGAAAGVIEAGATATVTFAVTVDSPLPDGLTEVINQATVGADGIDPIPTNEVRNPLVTPGLSLTKVADLDEFAQAGDVVTYTFVAANTGDATLESVEITDPLPGLSDLACDVEAPTTLEPDGELTCTATYEVTEADVDAGSVDNEAEACGTVAGGPEVCDQAEVTVPGPAAAPPADDPGGVGSGELARTGSESRALVGLGLVLLALGGFVLAGRASLWRRVRTDG